MQKKYGFQRLSRLLGNPRLLVFTLIVGLFLASSITPASAHSWAKYHWARTANPFTLQVKDNHTNLGTDWSSILALVASDPGANDWTDSAVLDLNVVNGTSTSSCDYIAGKVIACNGLYGNNGWLGIAQLNAYVKGHIIQGRVKMNDTYFNTTRYNDAYAKRHVECQEVGHILGLGHHKGLAGCMDDKNGLFDAAYQFPSAHDYETLARIYGHTDSSTTLTALASLSRPNVQKPDDDFGTPTGEPDGKGRPTLFEKDLGHGIKQLTRVVWAD